MYWWEGTIDQAGAVSKDSHFITGLGSVQSVKYACLKVTPPPRKISVVPPLSDVLALRKTQTTHVVGYKLTGS
jgi:hypothetical protein